ncbi:MAG: radical SAM protein [Monoglobaceae bacterium]
MPHYFNYINILILPTDACNMNCVYCFHKPYSCHIEKISISTVKRLLDITAPHYKTINIIWHGGEPLLMGLKFFQDVLTLQQEYDCTIKNSVQSNLTLLTPEMADFFAENDISISGSYDGVCNENLRGHSDAILSGRQLMIDRGKRCGLIMVVSGVNIEHLIESYIFFKSIGVNFSLNPYLEQRGSPKSALTLEANVAIRRMNELFDYWATDISGNIHISYFRNILEFLLLQKKSICSFTSCMGRWIGVHHDGTLGPCNRYFPNEYCFGNVHDYADIGQAFESDGFVNLLKKAIARREKCKSCEIFDFCCGGCNNTALNENGIDNNGGLSCKLLIGVFEHIKMFVESIDSCGIDKHKYNPLLLELIDKSEHIRKVNAEI